VNNVNQTITFLAVFGTEKLHFQYKKVHFRSKTAFLSRIFKIEFVQNFGVL